ncbi:hypothetical protein Pmani_019817 [Petrolisthes manimaculis]|uniref:Uncharacterized protein n=1 Tax=Petrolisthes manimaculis TaxID=1843537 RepID=A0AAE1PHT5_9EUCA|nr:hypothetical protein Pmani_019817 [Petrolisthes manimaculis]
MFPRPVSISGSHSSDTFSFRTPCTYLYLSPLPPNPASTPVSYLCSCLLPLFLRLSPVPASAPCFCSLFFVPTPIS